jgi:DNA-binding response OmpR family regulator
MVSIHFDVSPAIFFSDEQPFRPPAAGTQPQSRNIYHDSKRILVIDDETEIADSLRDIFVLHGYDAVAVYNGQAGIESARAHCPDIVVSDVVMPRLNGVDTVIAIKEFCAETHILLLSGQAATADILKKSRNQGHDFELMPKPVHPDALLKKLSLLWSE